MLFILKENENSSQKSTELEGFCIFPFTSDARKKADVLNCFKCYSYLQYSTSKRSTTLSQGGESMKVKVPSCLWPSLFISLFSTVFSCFSIQPHKIPMLELEHNPHIQVYRVSEFHDELHESSQKLWVITEGRECTALGYLNQGA